MKLIKLATFYVYLDGLPQMNSQEQLQSVHFWGLEHQGHWQHSDPAPVLQFLQWLIGKNINAVHYLETFQLSLIAQFNHKIVFKSKKTICMASTACAAQSSLCNL